ncbi:hypothetical protein [Microbacterium sp. H6]|uniref:hypothetical protein n=1 Tax=Microbacterium sp. H6 TaxID=421122 RepID=UPI000DE3333B|nr:hypothetical protein [Microbacterium sp. H6]RBO73503.1 hypothetical protein DSP71_04930 [Microbacterium sp. H6]
MPDGTEFCITNRTDRMAALHRADRPYPCRRRGMTPGGERIPEAHYAECENPDCRGCVPRSAQHGYLCGVCYRRVVDALGRLAWLIAHLRSIEKPAQAVGERVDTSMEKSILMPDPWIAADELMVSLGARQIRSTATIDQAIQLAHDAVALDVDEWISTAEGATQAVVMLKRMAVALKRWPDSEAQFRPIPHLQCPSCGYTHLWRSAPDRVGDELRVVCGSEGCGYVVAWETWVKQYAPAFAAIESDMKRREKAAKKEKTT